jgi:exopolysaccharide production protein ExoZ
MHNPSVNIAPRPMPQATRLKLHSVQYLRGIAALSVVVAHSISHPLPSPPFESVLIGHAGVLLFFVISGFIMVTITGDRFEPLAFIKHRIVRIVPLYWLVTIATAASAVLIPSVFKNTTMSVSHFVASLLFIPARNPVDPRVIEPVMKLGWTLNFRCSFTLRLPCFSG